MPSSFKLLFPLYFLASLLACLTVQPAHAERFRNPFRIPLSVDPYGVTTGDLNGDGRNDIVWTELSLNSSTQKLHVLLAGGGSQYVPAPDLNLPFSAVVIDCIVEDVTGDKHNDVICVAVASNYTDVFVFTYVGKGDGTFSAPVQTKLTIQPTFSDPFLGKSGDLNGDGVSDVVVMDANYSSVVPFLSDGHGGFKIAANSQGSFNSSVPTITDLNGDGKLDVLWPTGPRVNLGNGDGTFALQPTHYDTGYLSNCAFGDVDHDGHLDAACTFYDGGDLDGYIHFAVLHGNADGSFNTTPIFTRTFGNGENDYDGLATILSPILIADLNGDGYADVVSFSGDGYCVLLGGPNSTWNGKPEQFVATTLQAQGGVRGIYGVTIDDMNGDGLPDLVSVGPNGIYITYAQSDGTLSSPPAVELGQVSTSSTLVDVNGDGNLDVVSAGDTALKLSLGKGDGTFSAPQPITTMDNFGDVLYAQGRVVSGDFNGDGKQDLLATGNTATYTTQNYILFGHGDGTFDQPSPISIMLGKVIDLNHDGRSDVISVQNQATANNVLISSISRGDGTFSTTSTNLPLDPLNGFAATSVGPAVADFRHSGRLDAAVASYHNVYLLPGHGDGTFDASGTTLSIPDLPNLSKNGVFDLATGDFDGDGNADLAVLVEYGNGTYNLSNPTSAVWAYYGKGDGTFTSAVLAGTFNRNAQTLNAGDLNGDGLADLVLTSYNVYQYTGVLIVHALPNRAWGPEVDYTGGEGLSPLWITDINHDGRNDLIFSNANRANYVTNSISVLLNQPDNLVTGSLTASPEPSGVGSSFTLLATLSAPDGSSLAGDVDFLIDGVAVGSAPIANNAAQLIVTGNFAVGTHSLQGTWAGNSTFGAVTLQGSHTITGLPTSLTLSSSLTPSLAGSPVTFTYSLSTSATTSTSAGGSVTLTDNGALLRTDTLGSSPLPASGSLTTATLSAGTHTIAANYSGDSNYAASSATITQVVNAQAVTLTLSAAPNPALVGQSVQLTVSAVASGCPACAFSGAVQISDGGTSLGSAQLSADGTASLTVSFSTAGTHPLQATFPGDSYHQAATASASEQVLRGATTLSLASSPNPSTFGSPVRLTAALTNAATAQPISPGVIVFSDGTTVLGSVPVDANGIATLTTTTLAVGSHTITASFSQTTSLGSSTASLVQTVTRAASNVVLTGTPNPVYQNAALTLNAQVTVANAVNPGGPVQFFDGSVLIGSASVVAANAKLTTSLLAVGVHPITASYAGDGQSLPALSAGLSITVLPSDYTLSATPSGLSVKTEHHLTFSVSAQSVGNFADRLHFSASGLPAHMSVRFITNDAALTQGGQTNVSVYLDTDDVIGYARLSKPLERSSGKEWAVIAVPFALLAFIRRRRFRQTLFLICIALMSGVLQGCSGLYPSSTAPGSYVIQIQTSGTQTGLAHSLSVPVTVSQ